MVEKNARIPRLKEGPKKAEEKDSPPISCLLIKT